MDCKPEDWKKGKKIFIIICASIIIIAIILSIILLIIKPKAQNNNVDFTGPEYKPSNIYDDTQKEISLSDFSDKPMALIFFNAKNEKSIEVLKIFSEQNEEYSDKVNIVGICISDGVNDTLQDIKNILEQNDIRLDSILFDLDYSAKKEYDITTIPTLVCVDKKQEVINKVSAKLNEDVIMANLDILAENY